MTLENKKIHLLRESRVPSTHTNPMTFGKNLRMVDRIYENSDRDTQAFLRKVMLARMNEAKAMVASPQYNKGEKSVIKSNRLAMEDIWQKWNEEMRYE